MRGFRARSRLFAAAGFFALAPLTGCSAAAYGLGVATMVNDSKARQRDDYESYRRQAEAENAPNVMTFRQWVRSQQNG